CTMADSHQQDAHSQDDSQEHLEELRKKIEEAQQKEGQERSEQVNEEMKKLEEEIQALKLANEDAQTKALRALADLQNARRRMEEEKASFAAFANQGLILKVLDIYENYHRLLEHKPEGFDDVMKQQGNEEWAKGLQLIDEQFQGFLEQQGVQKIEAKPGDMIDPERHEAVMSGEGEQGVILEVFSPGYEMKGRVIKTAKV